MMIGPSATRGWIQLIAVILLGVSACVAQAIPNTIWGRWRVQRELPTWTISCWGDTDAKKIIGTQIEYSSKIFRWNGIVANDPRAEVRIVTADQFSSENSSPSSNGSQVSFRQLGIVAKKTTQVSIQHEPANITGATVEIPGDSVLVKDSNTIVFSVCNLYFEAKRVRDI